MITLTDLFCGAGGSSTGAVAVPDVQVRIAANHWQLAVDTHQANHSGTDHATADIHQADPQYFPATDVLWASPECTKWSVAQGKSAHDIDPGLFEDPLSTEAELRSRILMFDVPRFAEHHRYRYVIVENVVDISTRPQYVGAFERWLGEMHKLGYEHREVYLNSMHAQAAGLPAPQSRDRIYVVFWRSRDRAPDFDRWMRPQAWCEVHGWVSALQAWKTDTRRGRYRQQYVWRCPRVERRHCLVEPDWLPAAVAIDWSIRGERIGDRARPLAPKTMARIRAGLQRYATTQPPATVAADGSNHALVLEAGGNQDDSLDPRHPRYGDPDGYARIWPTGEPLRTLHTRASKALLVPVEGRLGVTAHPAEVPLRTQTVRQHALVVMLRGQNAAKPTFLPLDTFAANGIHHALVMRNNNTARGNQAQMCTPVDEVLRTLTTKGHQSLVQWGHLVHDYNGPARSVDDVLPTQTTHDGDAVYSTEVDPMDCLFRMLEPHEIAAGMAFPSTYVLLGNRRERVKQAGNAVTPPAGRDLVAAVAEPLGTTT